MPKTPTQTATKPKPRATRTNTDIYNRVLDVKSAVLDVKGEVLAAKEDIVLLRQHVNDRNEAIEEHIGKLEIRIDGKLDNDQVLTSLGFAALNNRWARWAFGAILTTALGTLAVQEWSGPVAEVARFLLHYIPF